jgi:glycogen operon protein
VLQRAAIRWSGVGLDSPDWSEHSHSLALTLESPRAPVMFHAMFHAYWEPLTFELPPPPGVQRWRRCIDTALPSPEDIWPLDEAPMISGTHYLVEPRSVVLLALDLLMDRPADPSAGRRV